MTELKNLRVLYFAQKLSKSINVLPAFYPFYSDSLKCLFVICKLFDALQYIF